MDNIDLKERIKSIAYQKNKKLKDVISDLNISRAGLDKAIKIKHIKLIQLEKIAEFLECSIPELLGFTNLETNSEICIANKESTVYNRSIAKNNFFEEEKTEIAVLRVENEQLKKIIDKQDKEIEFLRGQLMKG